MAAQNFFNGTSELLILPENIPQVNTLPSTSAYPDGTIIYYRPQNRLMELSSGSWVSSNVRVADLLINDAGTIGSVSDPDAVSIAANGNVSLTQSLSVANALSAGSAAVTGAVTAASVAVSGAVSGASGSFTGTVSAGGLSTSGSFSAGSISTGAISGSSVSVTSAATADKITLAVGGSRTIGLTTNNDIINFNTSGAIAAVKGTLGVLPNALTGRTELLFFGSGSEDDVMWYVDNSVITLRNDTQATAPISINSITGTVRTGGNVEIVVGGKGIDFSAAGVAANILDDYEEGTWSPGVSGPSVTWFNNDAFYTKVGRTVFASWNADTFDSVAVATGDVHSFSAFDLPFLPSLVSPTTPIQIGTFTWVVNDGSKGAIGSLYLKAFAFDVYAVVTAVFGSSPNYSDLDSAASMVLSYDV